MCGAVCAYNVRMNAKHTFLILFAVSTLLLSLGRSVSAETEPATAAAYTITFQSTWSETTHPFAGFPASAHWSNLVGATHNEDVTFWELGGLASPGIENVAELGSNGVFNSEVNAAIAAGDAGQWIQEGFSPFAAISSATADIVVQPDYPLLTLATMIAPSPDWFSGVSGLSLQDENGNWIESIVVDVYPYDAGTEEGNTYSGSNPATNPPESIFNRQGMSPFSGLPVGTVTATLIPPFEDVVYLTTDSNGNAGNIAFNDEDILRYSGSNDVWTVAFDGSARGIPASADIDAFLYNDGRLVLSFADTVTLPGVGTVAPTDLVVYLPNTDSYILAFDGSDVGLDNASSEDIDAIAVSPTGQLLVSITGNGSVAGLSVADEDLLAFDANSFGANTSGSWTVYFDGSDAQLSGEDVNGVWADPMSDDVYLSVENNFSLPGVEGNGADIFVCSPESLGQLTDCNYSRYFQGSVAGLSGTSIDDMLLLQSNGTSAPTIDGLDTVGR